MAYLQARRVETAQTRPEDIRDIRRHIQNLEFQVQQLRHNLATDVTETEAAAPKAYEPVSYRAVREILEARRARDQYFDRYLFGEPAWDILLELYCSELCQMRMTVSKLCVGAAVPATTALRWITNMEEAGLLTRESDPLDRRRLFVSLTDRARESLIKYFQEVMGGER